MKDEIWLLIGHGSRDQEGNEEFLKLVEALRKKNRSRKIDAAFVELAEPNLREILNGYGDSDPKTVWILPLLLFGAGHSKTDIPKVIHEARIRHPHVEYRYGTPFGIHPSLLRMVGEQIHLIEKGAKPFGREETAVLIIGRGSSDPDANSDLHKISRLLWEEYRFGWVETCFIGVTLPDLPSGIKRCVQLGAKRIIAIPYFIFTGAMIKQVEALLIESRRLYQEIEILGGQTFSKDPQLVELIAERFAEVKKGPVLMNCDLCKIQFPELASSNRHLTEKPNCH